jgi:hypothetical protein
VEYIVGIKVNVMQPKCIIFSSYLEPNIDNFNLQYSKKFLVKDWLFYKAVISKGL